MPSVRSLFPEPTVIPVVTIGDPAAAVELASALANGGLHSIEITLRVEGALESARAIRDALPDITLGIGTVTDAVQLAQAIDVGADFAVSPGFDETLIVAASDIPYLPAICTPSELMHAVSIGVDAVKVFPAAAYGGPGLLWQLAAVFSKAAFCPTGGIRAAELADYLAAPNVFAVGGSWLAPADLVAAGDWPAIEALARQAVAVCRQAN